MKVREVIRGGLKIVGAVAFVLICIMVVCYVFVNHERLLYTVRDHGYTFEVFYHPGGGATGPPHDLEVRVSGGRWSDEPLLRARAFDSLAVTMPDSDHVKIVVMSKDNYTFAGEQVYDWQRFDSTVVDLTGDLPEPPYIRRFE